MSLLKMSPKIRELIDSIFKEVAERRGIDKHNMEAEGVQEGDYGAYILRFKSIPNADVDVMLFVDRRESEVWAIRNFGGWSSMKEINFIKAVAYEVKNRFNIKYQELRKGANT